jgi:hypothetical protein
MMGSRQRVESGGDGEKRRMPGIFQGEDWQVVLVDGAH